MKPGTICEMTTKNGTPCTKEAVKKRGGKNICYLHDPDFIANRTADLKRRGVLMGGAAHKAKLNGGKPKRKYTKRSVRWTNGQEIEVQAFGEFGAVLLKAVRLAVRAELREMVGR